MSDATLLLTAVVELIQRRRGRFALTAAGQSLVKLSRAWYAGLEDFACGITAQPVEFALAAGESLLARLRERLPGVTWILPNRQTEEIVAGLAEGTTDIGIVRRDAMTKSLKGTPIGNLEFALFIPAKFDGAKVSEDFGDLLRALDFVVLEGSSRLNDALIRAAERAGVKLNVALRCSSFNQAAEVLRSHSFAAILPSNAKCVLSPETFRAVQLPFLKARARKLVLAWNPRNTAVRSSLAAAIRHLPPLLKFR